MANVLIYTSPARGHLFPVMGTALELQKRGHNIHIRTLSPEVERVRSTGLNCEPIDHRVEAREMDDWKARNPLQAIERAMKAFGDRAEFETGDLQKAIRDTGAELLLIDTNSWGAQTVAEASGLPWTVFQPYFTFLPAPGIPPFGPGLAPMKGPVGRLRNAVVRKLIFSKLNKLSMLPINTLREDLDLVPITTLADLSLRPPRLLYHTVRELEYPRHEWPDNFRFVGPGLWSPPSEEPAWLNGIDRPLALVTCSTERQSDRPIVEAALQTLPEEGFFVVATSAAYDPQELDATSNREVRLERFIPHEPVVRRASVVVCHGGMGITHRALSHGIPLVVIPFGRDQLEVARRVEYAGAGVRLLPKKLTTKSLSSAVKKALGCKPAAKQIAEAIAATGGERTAADCLEELLPEKVLR